jgi:hypothetical protein
MLRRRGSNKGRDHRADRGEALGFAALAADGPDVVGVEEGDPVLR